MFSKAMATPPDVIALVVDYVITLLVSAVASMVTTVPNVNSKLF